MMQKRIRYDLERSPLFGLSSRSRLASLVKISNRQLRTLESQKDNLYSEFVVVKDSGGSREIENPARLLKMAQSGLARLLSRIEPSKHLFCPVKGRSYVGNAASHLDSSHVYCLDIQKFFPSVSSQRVFWFFRSVMRCETDIAGLLTGLSTYKGHLPTGSPLSPILAYYCYLDMWGRIVSICNENQYRISIYVDDITISSKSTVRSKDIWEIKKVVASYGLRYHKERDFKHNPAVITGCVVHGIDLKVPHAQYKKRRLLQEAAKKEDNLLEKERLERTLSGLRVQMRQISTHSQKLAL